MNPQDPLANLHPLREPDLLGWWPMAPGWWLLLGIVLLCLISASYFLIRRYRANAYRRRALAQLLVLHTQYTADQDRSQYIAQTNALLKSVALRSYPPTEVAANSGAQWLAFLNRGLRPGDQFQEGFATATYQKVCPEIDMEALYQSARSWIRRHEAAR